MKNRNWWLLLAAAILSCTLQTEKVEDIAADDNRFLNVAYADASTMQQMDMFLPEGAGLFPAVLLIHGGGFARGDKKMEYSHAKLLVENGYAAICVNYRLSGEAVFPAAVHDCKAAVRFVKANAASYKIDAGKIGVWGSSAGGNLAAMLGTSAGDAFADGNIGKYTDLDTQVQACVDWFGPIDFSTMVAQAKELGMRKNFNVDIESKYLGVDANAAANITIVAKANPSNYLDKNDPPFLIQVGDADPLIPYLQSQTFSADLEKVIGKNKVSFHLLEGARHGGSLFESENNLGRVIAFLDAYLK
ncbi:MAG: alpha/beta hydrolase [Bacteroidota bacterium]